MPSLSLDHLLCETILHAEQQHSKQKTWILLSPLPLLCVQSESWLYLTLLASENILFYTLFLNGIISEPETLMRVTCRATVNGEIVTDWHVIESRLLAAVYDIDKNHFSRSLPPSLWSALIGHGWSSGINECGFHNVQDQVDPLLHRWLWLTPQVDSRPN